MTTRDVLQDVAEVIEAALEGEPIEEIGTTIDEVAAKLKEYVGGLLGDQLDDPSERARAAKLLARIKLILLFEQAW